MGDGRSAGTHGHTTASVTVGVVECDWLEERVIIISCWCSMRRIKDLVIIVDVLFVEMGDGSTGDASLDCDWLDRVDHCSAGGDDLV